MKQVNFIIGRTMDIAKVFADNQGAWSRVNTNAFLDHTGTFTQVLCDAASMRGHRDGVAYLCPMWYERPDYSAIHDMIDRRNYTIRYL